MKGLFSLLSLPSAISNLTQEAGFLASGNDEFVFMAWLYVHRNERDRTAISFPLVRFYFCFVYLCFFFLLLSPSPPRKNIFFILSLTPT